MLVLESVGLWGESDYYLLVISCQYVKDVSNKSIGLWGESVLNSNVSLVS